MKAEEVKLLKFLNSPKQLVIPIYQRAYNWEEKQCKQLWGDIIKAGENSNMLGHFIGPIVYVEEGLYHVSTLPKLLVIDGQQRLTTLSLLIAALSNHLKEKQKQIQLFSSDKLEKYYLFNDNEDGEGKYKLILNKSDKTTLFKILDRSELSEEDSVRLKENYEFFKNEIANVDLNIILNGISKLIIIDISLDKEKDKPQLIFESLNSTGLELNKADLIRNYILMGLEKQKQDEIYEKYWSEIEKRFGRDNLVLFDKYIKDYLTIKVNKIPKIKEIYSVFKEYAVQFNDIDRFVEEISEFSKYYVNITSGKEPDVDIRRVFIDINELKVDVLYPFILAVYRDYATEKINKSTLLDILLLIESYIFRRSVCGIPSQSLNKLFSTLYAQIDQDNYVESIKAIIILQDSYGKCPTDDEFKREFLIRNAYNFGNRSYLLRKLENYDRKEPIDVASYTTEHILPQNQNLSEDWKKQLGTNWKEIQKRYLHVIGNLTLTGYNSELSDKPFEAKRDMKGGFKDSPLYLNKELAKLDTWNEQSIKQRTEKIADIAINIWKYPAVKSEIINKYKAKAKEPKQKYTLNDYELIKEGEQLGVLFAELRRRILNIDSLIREEPQKTYIAYKSITNFVDIIPQKKALLLSLNMPFEEINDPEEKCKDVSGKGKLGNGDIQIKISNHEELTYVLGLIKQAFDFVTGI